MKLPFRSLVITFLGLSLFIIALVSLHRELAGVSVREVQMAFHSIPLYSIFGSLILTISSYLLLSCYDRLSLRFIERDLPARTILKGSFLGYALSHSLGFAVLTGGAARFGVYSRKGLSSIEIVKATAFNALIFWLSVAVILATLGVSIPNHLDHYFHLSALAIRAIGIIALIFIAGSFTFLSVVKVKLNDWEIELPSIKLLAFGIVIGFIDWSLAAYAAYILLPNGHVSFAAFLAIFVSAQIGGVLSHVPAGIGIFEASIIAAFSSSIPSSQILGSLLLFRVLYYLIPFFCAVLILLYDELKKRKQQIVFVAGFLKRGTSVILPQLLSVLILGSGALLLFSGAKPPPKSSFYWIGKLVPLPFIELSHFLGSIVGIGLIILARGIRRRLDTAYYFTTIGLAVASVATLVRGGHVEESFVLLGVLFLLLINKDSFYRKGSLLAGEFEPKWIFVVGITAIATIWLLFFAFKHVEYSKSLWWQFSLEGHAPRSLRGLVGATIVFAAWGWVRILSPSPHAPSFPTEIEIDSTLPIVRASQRTYAYLALLGDKHFLFNEKRTAFMMYRVHGGTCIAMGDPVGNDIDASELLIEFSDLCDLHGYEMAVYQVHHTNLSLYLDMGLYLVKIGEEAIVNLSNFSLEGSSRSWLRRNRASLSKAGYRFNVIDEVAAQKQFYQFAKISQDWTNNKATSEKGFSLGTFSEPYLKNFPFAIIEFENSPVAFANIWSGADKSELSIDLMRYGEDAPRGVMDFMFTELLLWGKEQGYKTFNLGMAPLSGLESHQLAPLWNRVGAFVFKHGEHFYNFQGLRAYKEKFDPVWEPRYLATSGVLKLPVVLTNIASVISGGLKGMFAK